MKEKKKKNQLLPTLAIAILTIYAMFKMTKESWIYFGIVFGIIVLISIVQILWSLAKNRENQESDSTPTHKQDSRDLGG